MPSRRACLAALAATAGCTSPFGTVSLVDDGEEPGSPTDRSSTDPETGATVRYSAARTDDLPAGGRALVVSRQWREWLRAAAAGGTVRAKATPEECGRSPLRERWPVRLRDAGEHAGTYTVGGDTGGYYEYDYRAERASPPSGADIHRFADLPAPVRDPVGRMFDGEVVGLPPQGRPYQFIQAEGRPADGGVAQLWVRRDGTVHRVYARVPTITPPCDYYLVLRLSPAEEADRTLSLATVDEPDTVAADARSERTRALSRYTDRDRALLREFDHLLTLAAFYEVRVSDD